MEQVTGSCCGEEEDVQIEDHTVEVTLHESHLACEIQEDELVTTGSDAKSGTEWIYQDSYGSWAASRSASSKVKWRGKGFESEQQTPKAIPAPQDDWKDFMKSFALRQQVTLDLLASQQQKQNENSWQRKPFLKFEQGSENNNQFGEIKFSIGGEPSFYFHSLADAPASSKCL
uniref:Uncharacterized protein n=1 Tax=Sphaerodactylus townsendi TaxID=933632 RepID=A0ACB8FF32_9SAUR